MSYHIIPLVDVDGVGVLAAALPLPGGNTAESYTPLYAAESYRMSQEHAFCIKDRL